MNKKIAALLLAATLTTGLGSFGTYAYFTDNDTLTDNVNITMGNLKVDAYWATDAGKDTWVATSNATEVTSETSSTLTFNNVKPGDTFERDVVVNNYGSLKADISVQLKKELPSGLTVELINVVSQTGKVQVDPNHPDRWYENAVGANGGFIRATVKVTVDPTLGNEWMDKAFTLNANEFIVVGAHQTIY
ncbi:MAG: TasA family protein [Clostridium sp.]|uniref:TasA family protein n=1 Tax=Clostridium sp. TaxID=1506 RepID=UPI0029081C47|nr:TasA family protein [Clostridium sp.]MDU5111468.1 TasA family protein [Clostridium sp.]